MYHEESHTPPVNARIPQQHTKGGILPDVQASVSLLLFVPEDHGAESLRPPALFPCPLRPKTTPEGFCRESPLWHLEWPPRVLLSLPGLQPKRQRRSWVGQPLGRDRVSQPARPRLCRRQSQFPAWVPPQSGRQSSACVSS